MLRDIAEINPTGEANCARPSLSHYQKVLLTSFDSGQLEPWAWECRWGDDPLLQAQLSDAYGRMKWPRNSNQATSGR